MKVYGKYKVNGTENVSFDDLDTDGGVPREDKAKYVKKTEKNQKKIQLLQDKLYADGREGLIIILQAMDAAGKDGTIKHVLSGVNPQGIDVYSFKQPNSTELSHDFLWRIGCCIPARGKIGLFNRSYYEDVLVVQVHEINKKYHMADRIVGMDTKDFFAKRYKDIVHFENYLYHNSYRVVKIFLHLSKDEQKRRFLSRIELPEKNWKFSSSDIREREDWAHYQTIYEDVINSTASKHAPWYVLPADQKWYTRYLVSEIILDTLKKIGPEYPKLSIQQINDLQKCKMALMTEQDIPLKPQDKKENDKKANSDSGKKKDGPDKKANPDKKKDTADKKKDTADKKKDPVDKKADSGKKKEPADKKANSDKKKDPADKKADSGKKKDPADGKADSGKKKDPADGKADSGKKKGPADKNADSSGAKTTGKSALDKKKA
ncbi:MAG: polyphosphate kinase 2 family protein [Lachnospiraceae bacterium]|nr:polyphosphate kinase 2 family protein [Lachnospiraceae bacterium]